MDKYHTRMSELSVGATIARKKRKWTVTRIEIYGRTIHVTMRNGRRVFRFPVPICGRDGPIYPYGIDVVKTAPKNLELWRPNERPI